MANPESFMKSFAKGALDFVDNVGNTAIKTGEKETILRSNKAINPIAKFVLGESDTGIRGTLKSISKGEELTKSIKGAYTNTGGKPNVKAIAGTYVGAAAAGRVLTGGGIYRDSTGNVNVPIVPFI